MKLTLIIAFAALALAPQPGQSQLNSERARSSSISVHLPHSEARTNLLETCNEIVARKARQCASSCGVQGKSSTFESGICGFGSTCKCS